MRLGGEGGVVRFFQISEPAAHELVSLVHRAVEQHVVIGHVEMAVIIDPFGLDLHHRRNEGRGEDRFLIGSFRALGFRSDLWCGRRRRGTVADFAPDAKPVGRT